jgi:hypothetical protein
MNTSLQEVNPQVLLKETGSIYLPESTGFFELAEWESIERIANSPELPWEKVTVGDADEPNDVYVGRFMIDVDYPRMVNESLARQLIPILASDKIVAYCQKALGGGELFIRRVQINKMGNGSFIGLHLDQDSNPDYEISLVLQLGQQYSGGAFVVHRSENDLISYTTQYRSVLISRCDLHHEVCEVLDGQRMTLVFFFSRHNGMNERLRTA